MRNRAGFSALTASGALALALSLTACSSSGDRAGRFCAEVREDPAALTSGVKATGDVGKVVERFRTLERTAPLAIEDDWARLTELVELAAAIEPGDTTARTRLVTAAYEADQSVQAVVTWVRGVCGVDLTIPVGATTSAPAATAPANPTPAPAATPPPNPAGG
jgi:hypothetical protein